MNKTIWILWGIWPEASATFYVNLIAKIKSLGVIQSNVDYPHIIINNINAPELLSYEDMRIDDYVQWIKDLELHNPDYIYMICNTIHIYLDTIKDLSWSQSIVSIKDLLYKRLKWTDKKICILWTENTIKSQLYNFEDINYFIVPDNIQASIQEWIMIFNQWWDIDIIQNSISDFIRNNNNLLFVSWCTEIRSLGNIDLCDLEFIDTMDLFIDDIINKLYR